MHSRTKAAGVIGSLAITATLLLAGCGGSSTADTPSAAASWNPPRPTGIPDANWADYGKDPATLTPEQLANACSENKPVTPELIDTVVGIYPGSTAEEWTAYADYTFAYLTPLCANLPSGAAAASTEPSAEASAESDAAASDMASEETASGAFPPVVDGDVSYQVWNDSLGSGGMMVFITNNGAAPVSLDVFNNDLDDIFLSGQGILEDGSAVNVGAYSCWSDEIPVGAYATCSLSGFEGEPKLYAELTLPPVTGNGSLIVIPVNAPDVELPMFQ